ncbi:carboxypeptidase M32 [Candidatus Vampirococcus lugosii]|uniref:Metal-dependent carboxypeptidase n=1 Tax=Candidatus Vampirococcus lugosii TaxID=2789015 RepID=A0ABS5QNV8_9BACT|nr:Thermostable carboxypeptidase 1 [Candidatus Vampirococcus lugosii]
MYQKLIENMKELKNLGNMQAILIWDMETYMPKLASNDRGEVLASLAKIEHEKLIDENLFSLIKDLKKDKNLDKKQSQNVNIIYNDIQKIRKLPSKLVQDIAIQEARTSSAWKKARDEENFDIFAEEFEKFLKLRKEQAEYIGYENNIYDFFIDKFDPGTKTNDIENIFSQLKPKLLKLISKLSNSNYTKQIDNIKFDSQKLFELCKELLKQIGYNFDNGRLDISTHPFTIPLSANDVRITTRTKAGSITDSVMSTIHEMGHAICELGTNKNDIGLPSGEIRSLAIHESQSMIWELYIAKNPVFWNTFFPLLKKFFPNELSNINQNDFIKELHYVKPSLIRTSADQLTYHIHIIIRYEIERLLLDNKIKVKDMPQIWNKKYKEYLGLEAKNLKEGVLQDIHWSQAEFGYFPTYSLGNMYASWIYQNLDKDLGGVDKYIENKDFDTIIGWLNKNIHQKGSLESSLNIINSLSKDNFDIDFYISFMENKYKSLDLIN